MKKFTDILFSYWLMLILFFLLGAGAAVATFVENDFGTSTARVLVYNHIWYEAVMVLSIINLCGIIYKHKMWKSSPAKFIFHFSFVVMLIGAALTRYVGFEGIMHIREGETQSKMISLEPYLQVEIIHNGKAYYQEYQFDLSAIEFANGFNYNIPFEGKNLNIAYDKYTFAKKGQNTMGILQAKLTLDDQERTIKLVGKRGMQGVPVQENFENTFVTIMYGSKSMSIPFALKLNDFQLDRYPGSMSPSSYASEITVIDKDKSYDARIFMNSTLYHGGYKFFQSSYDQDEQGTILSVNNDPGKWPTYLGYFLLTLGLMMNFFEKNSRFMRLTRYIRSFHSFAIVALVALFASTPSIAQDTTPTQTQQETPQAQLPQVPQESLEDYINHLKTDDGYKKLAKKFGTLVTQSSGGRMQPVDSMNLQIVQKLTRKSSFMGMDHNQIVLGMFTRPEVWRFVDMIKISTPKLKQELGYPVNKEYIPFADLFDGQNYALKDLVEKANETKPLERGTYEKDIIKLDERLNIAYMSYFGNLYRIFPYFNEGQNNNVELNNRWFSPFDAIQQFQGKTGAAIQSMIKGFINAVILKDYDSANKYLDFMIAYQKKAGEAVMPKQSVIDNEILFNDLQIFPKLTLAYILLGLVLFIVSFITVFNHKWESKKLNLFLYGIVALLFLVHTAGMGLRWYISGHAPWSDTYESLLYISWSAMFAGTVFFRKSLMALAGTVVMAGIFMFTAHLSGIDPQITNLVPVLKSYWLTIHVSIITASYGFFGLGAVLGFMSLLLFIARNPKKPNIDQSINHITAINEAALIIGLAMLVVGNFLGGVWANESWGRYWGWDPKETWAWVSIIVYAFVIHARFIKKLNNPFVLNTFSLVAFSSILMTYFGVNFYLSGMHSYATGDPVPIPTWVYVLTTLVFVVIALAYRKRDLPKLKV